VEPSPPRLWRALLRRLVAGSDGAHLVEDLDEMYRQRVRRQGPALARRWYRREIRACVIQLPLDRARRRFDALGEVGMGLGRQIRQAARRLIRAPGFTGVAVTTLALGIGTTTVILSLVDQAMLRPPPYPQPERLVTVTNGWGFTRANLAAFERDLASLAEFGGARDGIGMTLETPSGPPTRATVAEVSVGYLDALGIAPLAGRRFSPEEEEPGRGGVAMVAAGFARDRFGSATAALGERLTLDARDYEVVGVLPPGFDMPSGANQFWIPVELDPSDAGLHWGLGAYSLVGRLVDGATPERLAGELAESGAAQRLAHPLYTPGEGYLSGAVVKPLAEARAAGVRSILLVVLGAVGVLLLVVCANVANLLLSRALARGRDQAVRTALGAGRGRMMVDQMVEVGVLTALGVVVGLGLATGGLEVLRPHLPAELPGRDLVSVDLRVVALTGAVAVGVGLLSGLVPSLRAAGRNPASLLAGGGGRTGTGTRFRRRTTRVLVGAQLAAAVVLVVSAGLLGRSLLALQRVDPGFSVQDQVSLRVDLAPGVEATPEERLVELRQLDAALEAAVGGAPVSLATTIPFGGEAENMATFIPGVTDDPNNLPTTSYHQVDADHFEVMGMEVIQGRTFDETDRRGSEPVAVVDRTFADAFFPGGDAVGRTVAYPFRGAPEMRIVGVVEAVHEFDLTGPPRATWWSSLDQMDMWVRDQYFVVAPAVFGTDATLGALSRAARAQDARIAVSQEVAYTTLLGTSYAQARLVTVLLALVAGGTLLLGAVGVYGVASFWVRERVRDIGVRMALGADPGAIRRQVLRQGLRLAVPGAVLGLLLAVPATQLLEGLLFNVSAVDPLTLVVAPILLAGASLAAVYVPARRATRVDPVEVLSEG
jgi:predicted permease